MSSSLLSSRAWKAMAALALTSGTCLALPGTSSAVTTCSPDASAISGVSYTVVGTDGASRTITSLKTSGGATQVFAGETVTAHFTVTPPSDCSMPISLATYRTQSATFDPNATQSLFSSATGVFSAGSGSLTAKIPPGPTPLTIGPVSMEGALKAHPGDWLSTGYDFTIPGSHAASTVTFVKPHVDFAYRCNSGGAIGHFGVDLPTASYDDPAGSSAWFPSGDQGSAAVYQGSTQVPNLCNGGIVYMDYGGSFGATFTTGVASTTGDKVNVRFHYTDPAGRGRQNTNCADPQANPTGSACGASWSSTISSIPGSTHFQIDFVVGPVNTTVPPTYDARKIDWANG